MSQKKNTYQTNDSFLWDAYKKKIISLKKIKSVSSLNQSQPLHKIVSQEDLNLLDIAFQNFSIPKLDQLKINAGNVKKGKYEPEMKSSSLSNRLSQNKTSPPLKVNSFLEKNTYKKIVQNRIKIQAKIDLHHCTEQQAYEKLNFFLKKSYFENCRYVIVITGKGLSKGSQAKLRTMLPNWLLLPIFQKWVLAFQESAPRHGGSGAFYIMLRKYSKNSD